MRIGSLRVLAVAALLTAGVILITVGLLATNGTRGGCPSTPTQVTVSSSDREEISKLREENERLEEEISRLRAEINDLRAKVSSLRTETVTRTMAPGGMSDLESQVRNLSLRLRDLNESYQDLKRKYEGLLLKYNELKEEHDQLKKKYNDLLSRYENLSKSMSVLKRYRSSAVRVRSYVKEAQEFLKTKIYQEEFYDWRFWVISENYNSQMRGEAANRSIARIFALMVERDLKYNHDLYRRMLDDWLSYHPVNDSVSLANEVARLFYSIDHKYAVPGKDEPNAELPLFPIELLAYGLGDCEDHAMLMAALYKVAGIRVAIVVVKDHTDVAINLNGSWMYLESSLHKPNQEDLPSGFYSTVTIWELQKEFRDRWGGYPAYFVEVGAEDSGSSP